MQQAVEWTVHDEGYGYDVFGLSSRAVTHAVRASASLYERYFRVESSGTEHIPAHGPVIVVANHGGALPIDAAMLCLDLLRTTSRVPRAITDHFVPRLPLVSTLFARLGVVSGTPANVDRLLERNELLVIFPEGVSGPAKPYRSRYQLQRWRVGFAEHALRYRARIIPAAIVGAEESWPVVARLRLVRAFGSPYLPIPLSPVPLPARFFIRYGAPLAFEPSRVHHECELPGAVERLAERARIAVTGLLAETRSARTGVFR